MLIILTAALTACGSQTPIPATQPAVPTEEVPQPAQAPTATKTTIPTTTAPTVTESLSTSVSFAANIKPILDTRCIKCHGVEQIKKGLDLQTYENIFAGSNNGPVIEPGNADNSLLVQLIIEGEMPKRGEPVSPAELQLITDWINQGALNN